MECLENVVFSGKVWRSLETSCAKKKDFSTWDMESKASRVWRRQRLCSVRSLKKDSLERWWEERWRKERRQQRKKDQKAILERFLNTTTAQFSYWGGDKYKSGKDWVYGKNHNGKSRYKIFGLSKYNLSTKKGDVLHLKYIKRLYIRTSTYERIKNRNPNTLRSL